MNPAANIIPGEPKKPQPEGFFSMRTAFAGMASMAAGFLTYPVDTCKIRQQKQGEGGAITKHYGNLLQAGMRIVKDEGFLALYKGLAASMMREASYSSLRLGLYEPFKVLLGETDNKHTPFWKKVVSGGLSGCVGSAIANPADLVKVRLQVETGNHHTFMREVRFVYRTEGILGFYQGVIPTVSRAVVLNATKLATYDHMKHFLLNYGAMKDGTPLHVVCSFISGFFLTVTSAPFDLVKTRIMSQKGQEYRGMIDCFIKTVRKEGTRVLWKGFFAQWIRSGPFTVIQLAIWEKLRELWGLEGI